MYLITFAIDRSIFPLLHCPLATTFTRFLRPSTQQPTTRGDEDLNTSHIFPACALRQTPAVRQALQLNRQQHSHGNFYFCRDESLFIPNAL